MKITKILFASFFFISLLITSCTKDYVEAVKVDPIDPNAPIDSVYFSTDIKPIFTSCTGCHPVSNPLDLSAANAYTQLLTAGPNAPYVVAGDPASSLLYNKVNTGGSMNGFVGGAANIQKIYDWILQGALNN